MEEVDSIGNTVQPPAIDRRQIIDQVTERTAEKQQQQMNQLIDIISTLTSLTSFQSQQRKVSSSSANNTPHSGVKAIEKTGDNIPSKGVVPGNQMTSLINGGVEILPQDFTTSVKVVPGSRAAGHGHGGKGGGFIPPYGDNTPEGVAPCMSGGVTHNAPGNGVGSLDPDYCALSI